MNYLIYLNAKNKIDRQVNKLEQNKLKAKKGK